MTSGKMRHRLIFQSPADDPDEYGNVQTGWREEFALPAELKPLKGGEQVLASRLSGVQPYVIKIRSSAEARRISTAWRAIDARNGATMFNITAIANHDQKNAYLEIFATQGVAT